jgi:hypothetical protein
MYAYTIDLPDSARPCCGGSLKQLKKMAYTNCGGLETLLNKDRSNQGMKERRNEGMKERRNKGMKE